MSYSEAQQLALVLVPKFTGAAGLLSSLFIMSEIFHDYRTNDLNPIKRALFGVTFFEIFGALGWILSGWALPKGTDFVLASGSQVTCTFQAFIFQLCLGAPMFNVLLQLLFYLLVDGKHSLATIQSIEKVGHPFVVACTLFVTIVPMSTQQFNPFGQLCWINGYPAGCNESVFGGSDVPCERGFNAHLMGIIFFYIIIWIAIILIIILNVLTVRSLVKQGTDAREARFVGKQGTMYAAAFLITWMPSTIMTFMTYAGHGGFHWDILGAICEPLLGFWNMLIILSCNSASAERLRSFLSCSTCRSSSDVDHTTESVPSANSAVCMKDAGDNEVKGVELKEGAPVSITKSIEG